MIQQSFPLGLFVGGFRWSGSGAVSDWLAGHEGFSQHAGSGASFGEIRALNYGLRYLVQTASESVRWGERLGRWGLCPDPAMMHELLGPPLTLDRPSLPYAYWLADRLLTVAANLFIIPGVRSYKTLLDSQLGRDFRQDAEYRETVTQLVACLRDFRLRARSGSGSEVAAWNDEKVRTAASRLIGLFHRRLSEDNAIPIFDNAFSGLNPELFKLVGAELYAKRVFILVRRDPRDQFADLVHLSKATFSWSAPSFINQYRKVQEKTAAFLESIRDDSTAFVRLLNFEAFVLDTQGTRTRLRAELETFWDGSAPKGTWHAGTFDPKLSARNVGQWRTAGLAAAIRRIERDLPEFLRPESEGSR